MENPTPPPVELPAVEPPPVEPPTEGKAVRAPLKAWQNWLQFAIGFGGSYLLSGCFWSVEGEVVAQSTNELCIPILPVLALLLLIRRLRMIILGILSAMALNFVIALILGLSYKSICFSWFLLP